MTVITLRLSMPPSANHRLIVPKGAKRAILAPEHRDWKKAAAESVRHQLERDFPAGWRPFRGPVELVVILTLDTLASDATNRVKTLEDALTGLVYEDDRQVAEVRLFKRFTVEGQEQGARVAVKAADPVVHAELARRLEESRKRRAALERAKADGTARLLLPSVDAKTRERAARVVGQITGQQRPPRLTKKQLKDLATPAYREPSRTK